MIPIDLKTLQVSLSLNQRQEHPRLQFLGVSMEFSVVSVIFLELIRNAFKEHYHEEKLFDAFGIHRGWRECVLAP